MEIIVWGVGGGGVAVNAKKLLIIFRFQYRSVSRKKYHNRDVMSKKKILSILLLGTESK